MILEQECSLCLHGLAIRATTLTQDDLKHRMPTDSSQDRIREVPTNMDKDSHLDRHLQQQDRMDELLIRLRGSSSRETDVLSDPPPDH